jgi:hypothetical protein
MEILSVPIPGLGCMPLSTRDSSLAFGPIPRQPDVAGQPGGSKPLFAEYEEKLERWNWVARHQP